MTDTRWEINIQPELPVSEAVLQQLQAAIEATLVYEQASFPAGLTLLLTDDETLQQLNRDFLGYDQVTDVLSFPAGAGPYLGDIAISVPQAVRQAQKNDHDPAAELALLAVHATLHLLGHDHLAAEDKAIMWAAQAAILSQFNLVLILPT